MRRPLAAVCVTSALVLGAAAGTPAASADEAPVITSVDARPETVAISAGGSTQVTVDVGVIDDVAVASVTVRLLAKPRLGDDDVPPDRAQAAASLVAGTAQDGVWRATIFLDRRDVPGAWSTEIGVRDSAENGAFAGHVHDEHYSVPPVDDFFVKRDTRISGFNVAEPVSRGAYVRMQGRLLRLAADGRYVGFAGKEVRVWFKPAGSTTWRLRGTVTTGARGYFSNSRVFRAWRDGVWRAQFAGTDAHLAETSRGDVVDTR
jgi:hypothetical protein